MPYCPACRCEYREGIERCADCDVELVGELPTEQQDATTDEPLVTVFTAASHVEVEIVVGWLEAAGIPAHSAPGMWSWVGARTAQTAMDGEGELRVLVLESRADEAREIIEQALEAGRYDISESS